MTFTPVPYTFQNQTGPIPLSELDANFSALASVANITSPSFGADNTGTTDATSAIQAAANTGGNVFFPVGTYLMLGSINCTTPGQQFFGPGILVYSAIGTRSNSLIEMFTVKAANVSFYALTFDGQNAVFAIAPAVSTMIHCDTGGSRCRVLSCLFRNMPTTANSSNCIAQTDQTVDGPVVIGCDFDTLYGGALFFQCPRPRVVGNRFNNCGDVQVALNGIETRGATVIGNTFTASDPQAAIAVEEGAYEWTITGNTFGNCQRALFLTSTFYTGPQMGGGIFADNIVADTTTSSASDNFAVHIGSPYYEGITIRGNSFAGLNQKTAVTSFINVASNTSGLCIENNLMESKAQAVYGIEFFGGSSHSDVSIKNNQIRSNSSGVQLQAGIWLTGAAFNNLLIQDNFGENIANQFIKADASGAVLTNLRMRNNSVNNVAAIYGGTGMPWGPTFSPGIEHNLTTISSEVSHFPATYQFAGLITGGSWNIGDRIVITNAAFSGRGVMFQKINTTQGVPTWKALIAYVS